MKILIVLATLLAFIAAPLHAVNSSRNIEITGEVTWEMYDKVVDTIDSAPNNGVLFVYIDSPGGNADAGDEIAHKLKRCKANVVTVIEGTVASVAFNILIAGDYVAIDQADLILIHAAYIVVGDMTFHVFPGSGLDQLHAKQIKDYKGYLTPEEEKFVFEDWGDLTMSPEIFLERVDNDITKLKRLKETVNGNISTISSPTRVTSSR